MRNDYMSPELVTSINVSSVYMKAWFKSTLLTTKADCLNKILCDAEEETDKMKSPVGNILSEILRCITSKIILAKKMNEI